MKPCMVELFAGTGTVATAFRRQGWEAVTLDIEEPADIVQDIRTFRVEQLEGMRVDFVWASPPCNEFSASNMPWHEKFGTSPSLELLNEARRIIIQTGTPWWCIENVAGAVRHFAPSMGEPQSIGPVRLWHNLPYLIEATPVYWKTRLGGTKKKEWAAMPMSLANAVALAVTDAVSPPLFTK